MVNLASGKIICVGRNKTGTTSLEQVLRDMGFRLGDQASGEILLRDWAKRDFSRIIALCETADAFQDVPFSLGYTFQAIDAAFPGSKFILTVRNNPAQWYESLIGFHTQIVGTGRIPTAEDLAGFPYRYRGYLWESAQMIYGVDAAKLYDRDIYIAHYINHNHRIIDYFRHRPADLLVLNVAQADAMRKLCAFLGRKFDGQSMPHLNRSPVGS